MLLVGWMGGMLGGGDFPKIFMSIPLALFGALVQVMPDAWTAFLGPAMGHGWQFSISGWLIGISLLLLFSIVMGAILTYWFAAGTVNYNLLTQDEED